MEETQQSEKGTITMKKSTIWQISTLVFAVLFVISLFTGGFGIGNGEPDTTGNAVAPPPSNGDTGGTGNIKIKLGSEDPILGDEDAPVTIVEFSDFQCPFCARASTGAIAELKDNEIKDGKVKLAFLDFPLSFHQHAQKSAEAAQCAHDQEKFWEYHDLLFENQAALDLDSLKQYAEDLELDTDDFNDCLDSGKHEQEAKKDMSQGSAAGCKGTPCFVVIGPDGKSQIVSGARPYESFKTAINAVS